MPEPIPPACYLDHQATTPVDPRVVEAMVPYGTERFGHPASRQHAYGWAAEKGLEAAREEVAALLGAESREIVFTSGGTEADNLAVKGAAEALRERGRHLVTSTVENRPVLDSCAYLAQQGWDVTQIPVDGTGRVDAARVAAAMREDTVLVSLQLANHEVGTIQDVAAVGAACAEHDVWLHTDATQAAAWLDLDVSALGVHLLSISGNKMHGPKGIGALYVRRRRPRVRLVPLLHGGGHERGLRSGTVNVPGAVGLGRAARICREEGAADRARVARLRDALEAGIRGRVGGVRVLGDVERRLPNGTALAVERVEGEALLLGVPSVALATGSACTSATAEASHVLRAMGLPPDVAATSVRFGLGRFTTEAEIERTVDLVTTAITRIRGTVSGQ